MQAVATSITAIALVFAVLLVLAIIFLNRNRSGDGAGGPSPRRAADGGSPPGQPPAPPDPGASIGFGYKIGWIAVRGVDSAGVIQGLGLESPQPSAWQTGLEAAYSGMGIFVSPRLGDWVLVVGRGPWDVGFDDVDFKGIFSLEFGASFERTAKLLEGWSGRLKTEVQFFYTHRIPEAHAWIRCDRGSRNRLFWYAGQNGEGHEEGVRTEVEREIGLAKMIDASLVTSSDEEAFAVGEEEATRVAGAWSIDPTTIEDRFPKPGPGWLARFPRR